MPKLRNCRGDFDIQITKSEMSVLRPKPGNPPHLSFEAQPRNRPPVLRPNQKKPSPPVLRPNWLKPSEWFWGQTTHKPSTLVLRLNQETRASSLHVPGADRTRCTRPLDRPATEYPTCATIPGPLHQVSYSYHGHHCCTSCRACHLHTTRQANVIIRMKQDKRKTKQNYPAFKFKLHQVNDSSQSNQGTDHLISHVITLAFLLLWGFVDIDMSSTLFQ
jgi:hypothetical protein